MSSNDGWTDVESVALAGDDAWADVDEVTPAAAPQKVGEPDVGLYQSLKDFDPKAAGLGAVKGFTSGFAKDIPVVGEAMREAQERSPGSFTTGEVAGGLGQTALPIFRGATALGQIGKAALQGGLAGVGYTEGDDVKRRIIEGAKGAAIGGGIGAGALGAGRAAAALPKKFTSAVTRVPEEHITKYLDDSARIDVARGFDEIADDVAEGLDTLRENAKKASYKAMEEIPQGTRVPAQKINEALEEGMELPPGAEIEEAMVEIQRKMAGYAERIAKHIDADGTIDAHTLKNMIKTLDKNIKWDKLAGEFATPLDAAKSQLRHALDAQLKTLPGYAEAMPQVAAQFKALANASRFFKRPQTTAGKLERGARTPKKRHEEVRALQDLDKMLGTDFSGEAGRRLTQEAFTKASGEGSANVNLMAMMGAAGGLGTGGLVGGAGGLATGALLGRLTDRYGSRGAQVALDKFIKLRGMPAYQRISGILSSAAKRGPQAVAVTEAILRQRDPAYQELDALAQSEGN